MPTSARGSDAKPAARRGGARGFTLIELLVVLTIVAIASGLAAVALRDGAQARLEEEAARLSALLESARTEARAAGIAVRWEPLDENAAERAATGAGFRFAGLPADGGLPTRWLRAATQAEVVGARVVVLGPEPILPPQRIVLRLDGRVLELASDGLGPFTPVSPP
ncbi:MAG TPA: prepilin-type N-terminal cleavage/methylation domain-containing protein [Burkholderiaceae bacterium]|nr:prepilin-type N-terminal cleavage/methylation domain-containing protein [Burkholderiaceae bacterium]